MSNIFRPSESYDDVVSKNRYGIRTIQARYLQNEYEKMQNAKKAQKLSQQLEKSMEHEMLNKLSENYLNQISQNRRRKARDMRALSNQYDEFIRSHQEKQKIQKSIEKNIEKSTLASPNWIRDVFTERDAYRKNMDYYNKSLGDHIKLQQIRKQVQKEQEMLRQKKLQQQANNILKKEMQEMEARHRQRSLFEKRQNELLGVKSQISQNINSSGINSPDTIFRRREQDLYSKGLQIQLKKEQQKRQASQNKIYNTINSNVYNPITNPIPYIYKNPNVIRTMMAKN